MERKLRNYRADEDDYRKAMKRAKKEKTKLAIEVERFVYEYGKGMRVMYCTRGQSIKLSMTPP